MSCKLKSLGLAALLLLTCSLYSYSQSVKGTIYDEEGLPLIGATVMEAGTTNGTFTDLDGKYLLNLTKSGEVVIEFRFIGLITQTKTITTGPSPIVIDITMQSDSKLLDDVVIVGYGVQRKNEVTGSITSISAEKIASIPTPSFESAIQGQAAGVQVSQGSGMAGSGALIKVRGVASVSASGDPLYVVDGIPITQDQFTRGNGGAMNTNPLASINPNDIESIEILKDASATGIYGSRGANGVILITTKRATKKGLEFDFTSRVGIGMAASKPNMLNTDEYLQIRQEAWENDGGTGYVWLPNFTTETSSAAERAAAYNLAKKFNTDWVDQTIGTGVKQTYSLGMKKGADRYKAYVGFTYDDNESYLLGNSYNRISGRVNFDYNILNNLKVMLSTSLSQGTNNRVDAAWSGGLGRAMSTALPFYPLEWTDELEPYNAFFETDGYAMWGDWSNPAAVREHRVWRDREYRSINNLKLIYSPFENFNLVASGGFDYMDFQEDTWSPEILTQNPDDTPSANLSANFIQNWNYSVTGDYLWQPTDRHKFNFLLGNEYQRSDSYGYGINFPDAEGPIFNNPDLENEANSLNKTNGTPQIYSFLSYFGRVNYVMDGKYILQATARVDGSSRFGRNNRYGFFPAISAGWLLSQEDFLRANETISYMKLRASFGVTGNANFANNAFIGTYSPYNNGSTYNQQPILYPLNAENPDLKWETSSTFDAAVEVGLWKDRVTFEVAYYRKNSKDILLNVELPSSTGFDNYWDNVAEVLNEGVEFSIKSRNMVRALEWTTEFNIAHNYNELVDIGDYTADAVSGGTNDSRVLVGRPIGSFYMMAFSHIDTENGLPVYFDAAGKETYDYDLAERSYVGDGLPDFVGGITNSFRYKNWDFSGLATFSYGGKIFDSSAKRQLGVVTDWNMRSEIFDRWRSPGDESTFPRLTLDETTYGLDAGNPWWNTSLFVFDASYLRMRQVTLGYTFDTIDRGSVKIRNLRISASAFNLFTVTDFPGLDPEVVRDFENAQDRNLSPNVTYLTPPQERSYHLQLSFTF